MLPYDKNKLMKFLIFIELFLQSHFNVNNKLPLMFPSESGLPSSLHSDLISFV